MLIYCFGIFNVPSGNVMINLNENCERKALGKPFVKSVMRDKSGDDVNEEQSFGLRAELLVICMKNYWVLR